MKTKYSIFQILKFSGTTFCGLDIDFIFNGNMTKYLISNLTTQIFSGYILENKIIKELEHNNLNNYKILNILRNIFPGKNIANSPFYIYNDNIYLYFIVINDNYEIKYNDSNNKNNILNICGINIFEYYDVLNLKLMKVNIDNIKEIRYNKKTYIF